MKSVKLQIQDKSMLLVYETLLSNFKKYIRFVSVIGDSNVHRRNW